jgi:thiamine-monophosphate kinase
MKITNIGEFGFINRISPQFLKDLPEAITGIGDDCAVIPISDKKSLLVTTDMLIEDIHFLRDKISPRNLGYKSLAVNLSDIAAMGGKPESIFLSLGLPRDIDVEWLDDFFAGLNDLAIKENLFLLGGDTTKSPKGVVISITVLGKADSELIKYRSSAKKGDVICVTDFLGDSGGGLKALLEKIPLDDEVSFLVGRHHKPRPHLAEGSWLSEQEVHAMMDISDGIDSDLRRIMEQSNCGADIYIERLPESLQLKNVSGKFGWNTDEIAVTGGEDYCLLLTIAPELYATVSHGFEDEFHRPLYNIGVITEMGLTYLKNGEKFDLFRHGFDHFNNY